MRWEDGLMSHDQSLQRITLNPAELPRAVALQSVGYALA
jgi:hypothetical protein